MKVRSGILTALLVSVMASAAGQNSGNAAFYYWKAVGLMRPPRNPEQLEAMRFIEEELPLLSPGIFKARPAVLGWLLSEQVIRNALRDAAQCAECDFGVQQDEGPFLDLSHLPRLSALCRRVCAMAQALEYAGRPEDAAQAYVGLLWMIRRLDTDRAPASGLAAADMMQTVLWSLEGFVSGSPSAEALAPLKDFFRKAGGPPFHPADYLRDESERVVEWLRQDGPAAVEQMRPRVGEGPLASALAKLEAVLADKDRAVFEGWVAEYRSHMNGLAEAFEQPFARGASILKTRDAERAALLEGPDPAPNPLLVLLVPTAADLHQRILLAHAQWDMAALLCVAAEQQARTGNWPAEPRDIAKRLGRAFPPDPFSGEAMHYRLVKGRPVLGARIPRAMAESGRWMYTLDLAERARRDAERTQEAIRSARAIEFRELFEPAAP